jgi:hypothetical protein
MAAKDTTGLALASDFSWTFSTGATTDTTAPTVTGTIHANGQTNVAVNTKVGATFSEAMDPATVTALTFLVKETVGSAAVAGTVAYSGVGAVFSPQTSLKPSTGYTVTVKGGAGGAKDLAGNPLATDFVIAWTTGLAPDTTAPRVIATINANGATGVPINTRIGATFSEGMDAATITATTFTFKQGTSNVASAISYSGVDVVLTPVSPLASSTVYTATISTGVKDLAGNAVAADYVWSWTTAASADATSPTITLANPANLATNVAVNSAVNATFSKAMDPLTISTANFAVQTAGPPLGPILAGLTAYDAVSRIATFTPSSPLAAGTTYSVTFTGAKDLTGNALIPGVVPNPSTFATAADSVLAPGAVALGSAGTYGIMATSAVTNTGLSTINGDVSLDPGTSMTGFPPGVVNGAIHINDSVSAQARADLLVAYNFAKTLAPGTTISGGADLGALYPTGIPPGTYTSGSTMLVSTPLTLDAGGNANAVWVFQIGSSLTTGASVSLANGAQAKNVFWVPTSDATIGVGTIFYGTIVSGRDVTAVTGATINGRILAGAITAGTIALQTSTVNVPAP